MASGIECALDLDKGERQITPPTDGEGVVENNAAAEGDDRRAPAREEQRPTVVQNEDFGLIGLLISEDVAAFSRS